MGFRHEWKHEINQSDLIALRHRLRAVAKIDDHALNGKYEVRSLYFDNLADQALREKRDGVNGREKFRLRYYNGDLSLIHLEKKSKINGLTSKESADISRDEVFALLQGASEWMMESSEKLIKEFYYKKRSKGLYPKTIVDYTREAFFYRPGNVRVTLDSQIRTGMSCVDFLNPSCVTIPAGEAPIILEVKWDAYLPSVIRDCVQLSGRHTSAFSKYAACRIYG